MNVFSFEIKRVLGKSLLKEEQKLSTASRVVFNETKAKLLPSFVAIKIMNFRSIKRGRKPSRKDFSFVVLFALISSSDSTKEIDEGIFNFSKIIILIAMLIHLFDSSLMENPFLLLSIQFLIFSLIVCLFRESFLLLLLTQAPLNLIIF